MDVREIWMRNQKITTVGEATRISGSWWVSVSRLSGNNKANWGTRYSSQEKKKGKTKGRGRREWGPDSFPNSFPVFFFLDLFFSLSLSLSTLANWSWRLLLLYLSSVYTTGHTKYWFFPSPPSIWLLALLPIRIKPWKVAWNWRKRGQGCSQR